MKKYVGAVTGSLIAFVCFSLLAVYSPLGSSAIDVEVFLTVSTFLFAILVGFFISRLNKRFDQIREYVSDEDALWLSFYKTSEFFGKRFSDEIREHIDKYTMLQIDNEGLYHYKTSARRFFSVYESLKLIKNKQKSPVFKSLLDYLKSIEEARNRISILLLERLSYGQWAVLYGLAVIIIFSLFQLRTDALYSQGLTITLCTVLVLILLLMRDLQNFRLGGKMLGIESSQEVFDFIGKKRYYSRKMINRGMVRIPKHIKTYRVGSYHKGKRKIVFVKR